MQRVGNASHLNNQHKGNGFFPSYFILVEDLFSFIVTKFVPLQGRFYFGEMVDGDEGCDDETSAVLNTHLCKIKDNNNLRALAITHSF